MIVSRTSTTGAKSASGLLAFELFDCLERVGDDSANACRTGPRSFGSSRTLDISSGSSISASVGIAATLPCCASAIAGVVSRVRMRIAESSLPAPPAPSACRSGPAHKLSPIAPADSRRRQARTTLARDPDPPGLAAVRAATSCRPAPRSPATRRVAPSLPADRGSSSRP